MKARILAAFLILMLPFAADSQSKKKSASQAKKKTVAPAGTEQRPMKTFKQQPAWAPKDYHSDRHIYFPDYHTFYDPNRGYVSWQNNDWVASPVMPLYMKEADLRNTQIQILEDLSIDKRPELSYPRYMKMYPAGPGSKELLVPVPKPAGQPGTP
jgi:hypothetical protein